MTTNSQIQKAEDLTTAFPTPSNWHSMQECKRTIFRRLDISTVAKRKIPLLDAMDSKVNDIFNDALDKGILEKNTEGFVFTRRFV